MINVLAESEQWFMDGTFKIAPRQMMQLFTIHSMINQTTIPCVYILTMKKDTKAYREAFGVLKDLGLTMVKTMSRMYMRETLR